VYAASDRSGLGFHHLGYEQGVQKCLQVIKHLRAHTTIGRIYDTTITHSQLMSGLSRSILVDTRPLPWSSARWIDQLRDFLCTIQGCIDLRQPWIPPPRREHDRFIMDDVLHLHIPKHQAIQIQHVQLFLRVNSLSDITDHCGTHIIPAMLHLAPVAQHDQHYKQNHSTLQWPHTHQPGPAAWRAWSQFITWMYLQPNSMRLQHPLGSWLPTYDRDYQWNWLICPHTKVLFHYASQQWWAYLPVRQYPTHIGYHNRCSPTSNPGHMVPVTPILFTFKIHIPLPISTFLPLPPCPSPHRPLAIRIVTPPYPWEEPLWHHIQLHVHTDTLCQALVQRHIIRFVSNAAVHPSRYGTCAWII